MDYILDTHSFLWFCIGAKELSEDAKKIIQDSRNTLYISVASIWEIAIKNSLEKLTIEGGFESIWTDLEQNNINVLSIGVEDLNTVNRLPFIHRDPFDRLILAQTLSNNLTIISKDNIFDNYLTKTNSVRVW